MVDRPPVIGWFRDDLRLSDHPALSAAAKTGGPVIGLHVRDEESRGVRPLGGAARWWLPAKLIHQPWRVAPLELKSADVELGRSYPEPIVDRGKGRERALAAYARLRKR